MALTWPRVPQAGAAHDDDDDGWAQYESDAWWKGDVAALQLDVAAGTLTMKHRRHGRAFVIAGLQDSV